MAQSVYLADDEKNIRDLIALFLVQEGFDVQAYPDGDTLLNACIQKMPDLVILDIMMPGSDVLSICSKLRQTNPDLPIIMVSAKDSPFDRITGLTLGSDDYLVKPFLPQELVARVRAVLRRAQKTAVENSTPPELTIGTLTLFPCLHTAMLNQQPLPLTPAEFDFLSYMILHQERAVSREELLQTLWKMEWQADTRAADDLVKRLRRKLRERQSDIHIETVWGFGFRLVKEEVH